MKRLALLVPLLALAAVAIAAGSIWGCAADRPAIQTVDPSALRFAFGNGEAGSLMSFDFSSKEESLVRDWIAGLGKGGTVSFVTYAPGPLTVSSPDFTANFLADGTLVLNAKNASGSGWTQTVRERTAVDSAFFDLVTEKLIANLVTIPTAISADRKSELADIEQSLADGWPIEYSSLTNILGSAQEIKEFSVPFHLWFFDDGTCLVVSESGWGGHEIQRFHWIDCAPGQFDVLMVYHPLPAELKTKLQLGMDLESLWKLLGPDDGIDITRSGTALFLWYFDDDTCLVTGKTGYNQHAFFHCRPGRYPRNGKGMEEMRIIE